VKHDEGIVIQRGTQFGGRLPRLGEFAKVLGDFRRTECDKAV
jgi:hypothetical protein